jgi:putative CocE/NonD family hydrolase
MRTLLAPAVAVAALAVSTPAFADAPPPGSTWTQASITESDGTKLHADVLRPSNLPAGARTPVILSIGPYFNHSGQTGPAGPLENTPYTPTGAAGPSARFYDFINGAHLMDKGYTWVQVDLRGFGGSTGCLDWAGPGEQADVKAAVEWAASQPWSTG